MSDGNFLELPACPYSLLLQLQTVCAYMYMYQIFEDSLSIWKGILLACDSVCNVYLTKKKTKKYTKMLKKTKNLPHIGKSSANKNTKQ